jgi:hypothetical protein
VTAGKAELVLALGYVGDNIRQSSSAKAGNESGFDSLEEPRCYALASTGQSSDNSASKSC